MELDKVERTARLCESCPKMCRHVCTTHKITHSEADTPNQRCATAYWALKRGSFTPEEVPFMYEKCAVCGLCLTWCETELDAGDVMLAARADIVRQGLAPESALAVNQSILDHGNPHGEAREERFAQLEHDIANLPDTAEVLYFLGCDTAYRQPQIASAAIKVLKAAGVNFTVLKESELCCGEPQRLLGFVDEAAETAHKNVEIIKATGAKQIVYSCPSCLRVMKETYPQMGSQIPQGVEMLHNTQFMQRLLAEGKLKLRGKVDKRVTYHDPCDLGRRQEIYETPREVLQQIPGVDFAEMYFNRQDARCCGAGGGLGATNLGLVVEASREVVDMAGRTGADILVTACPTCKNSFVRHTYRDDALETLDIMELAVMALGED
jgi:heterodisulfide reductase subunit D